MNPSGKGSRLQICWVIPSQVRVLLSAYSFIMMYNEVAYAITISMEVLILPTNI